MRVACRLRQLRVDLGQSLRDVATETGINRGVLSMLETGRHLPTDAQVPILEHAYGAPWTQWYTEPAAPLATLHLIRDDQEDA